MASILPTLADALVALLNEKTFSQDFTAVRTHNDWALPLEKAGPLRVEVAFVGKLDTTLLTRSSLLYVPSADIVIRQKFEGEQLEPIPDTTEMTVKAEFLDPLLALVEEINEYLTSRRLPAYPEASWEGNRIIAPVSNRQLREKKQFTGIIRPTYRAPKTIPTP
ncbi:MAG: hypothetical protein L0211_24405 [Planctomycetaceae bacterium]|nr:hypothetical protein [Planctomycetaceae bacterium]